MAKTTACEPPKTVKNGARPPPKPAAPDALKKAIMTLGTELLRKELEFLCQEFPAVIHTLEDRLLVQGKDVVRYHMDTDSEDNANSEESESESSPAGGEEYTARMATCENCDQEFDVTLNERGDCLWHPGIKTVDYDSDFWADHDVNCHGPYDAFEDDDNYAEGFMWDCCDEPGDDEGCKSTKHKTASNIVVPAPPPPVPALSKKRKVEEEVPRTSSKKGRQESPS
ncbi:MAG: hypothetical protein M1839_003612 [Geoglossum umbratile]|nr:MAG: hypothetical protein M1839_003612 [Geoglossum umbratile]